MSFAKFFSRQAGNPSGWFGRWIMSLIFDKGNAKLNEMMKSCLGVRAGDRILEIGCGTGNLIGRVAAVIGDGCIEGVEISPTMYSIARKRNQDAIAGGRAGIQLGDFNEIAFEENAYDAVCSCNTVYFWSDPLFTLKKIHSVLKPAGKLAVAFEDKSSLVDKPISKDVFTLYSVDDLVELMHESGFDETRDFYGKPGRHAALRCVVAQK